MPATPAPALTSLMEFGLYVADVQRAAEWYDQVFGFPVLLVEGDRLTALQAGHRIVLLLFKTGGSLNGVSMPTGFIPPHDGSGPHHIAFAMEKGSEDQWTRHLKAHGVTIDSTIEWPEGGTSFYFRDPDGHLLELITPKQWKFQPWMQT